jgi:DNA-binding Lrp family transcriptional regulator
MWWTTSYDFEFENIVYLNDFVFFKKALRHICVRLLSSGLLFSMVKKMDWKDRSAYAFIKTKEGKAHDVWQRLHTWKNMIGTWIVTGEYDVIAWYDAQDWNTIHDCVATIKEWDEVEHTTTHLVHQGYKKGGWWWEKPVGAWMLLKENKLDETTYALKNWQWITSGASIPGDWDYMAWIEGERWDDVWSHLMEAKAQHWRTSALIPIKSWWNHNWEYNWW